MKNVMIDLETMSLRKNAAILSIGAVEFYPDSDQLGDVFYQNITLSSSLDLGLHKLQSTEDWWNQEKNREARDFLTKNAVDLRTALIGFRSWLLGTANVEDIIPWGNSSTFDIVVLESSLIACQLPIPWSYKNESCYRTLSRLFNETIPRGDFVGIKHHALEDAKNQAIHLMRILRAIGYATEKQPF